MWANDLARAGDRKRGGRESNVQAVDSIGPVEVESFLLSPVSQH